MIETRPMEVGDYVAALGAHVPNANPWHTARDLAQHPAFSLWIDDELAVCAGIARLWPHVGEAWAVVTPVGRRHPLATTRAVARGLRLIIENLDLRRVQADVVLEFDAGHQWAAFLGFRAESRMPHYGPRGETMVRYVLFPGEER